jgi:putative endonuclease
MSGYKKIVGHYGEDLAKNFLERRGYKIIERNKKISHGELDIVARDGSEIVGVEVKTLASETFGPADLALTRRQIKILKKTLSFYCWQKRTNPDRARLDFVAININRREKTAKIKYYKNIL